MAVLLALPLTEDHLTTRSFFGGGVLSAVIIDECSHSAVNGRYPPVCHEGKLSQWRTNYEYVPPRGVLRN